LVVFPIWKTSNATFTPDGYDGSPDRVDALVWALSELMLGDFLEEQDEDSDLGKALLDR
jgi:phage terminase large subunit-like protein